MTKQEKMLHYYIQLYSVYPLASRWSFSQINLLFNNLYNMSDNASKCYNNHGRFCTAGPTPLIKVCYGSADDSLRAAVNHLTTHSDYGPINQLVSLWTRLVFYLNR